VSHKVELKQSIVFLNIIKSSANILQFLIKDMIDLMNLRLDRFNQQTEVFSPIDACNEILIYYEFQAHEKGLYLKRMINNEARSRIIKLASDKQRYMQILLNIVQNSVKFTYYGGVDIILDFKPHLIINDTHSSQITPRSKVAKFS
jgi:two-component system sensor histidine kinase BarA